MALTLEQLKNMYGESKKAEMLAAEKAKLLDRIDTSLIAVARQGKTCLGVLFDSSDQVLQMVVAHYRSKGLRVVIFPRENETIELSGWADA